MWREAKLTLLAPWNLGQVCSTNYKFFLFLFCFVLFFFFNLSIQFILTLFSVYWRPPDGTKFLMYLLTNVEIYWYLSLILVLKIEIAACLTYLWTGPHCFRMVKKNYGYGNLNFSATSKISIEGHRRLFFRPHWHWARVNDESCKVVQF